MTVINCKAYIITRAFSKIVRPVKTVKWLRRKNVSCMSVWFHVKTRLRQDLVY